MKVVQLCKFFPPVAGGMESVVFELAEGLARRGVDIDVLCANTERRTVHETAAAGYRVTRAALWGRVLASSITPALVGEVKRLGAASDIVHVHLPDPQAAVLLRHAPPWARLVVHWHSDVVRQKIALHLYEPLQQWLLNRADAVIATSQAYADSSPWLRRWAAKTTVIPIGIGDNACRVDPARVAEIDRRFGGRKIVFSLGRMAAYKGFDVLIDAAARLPADAVVVAGGDGELLEQHRRTVASRRLGDKIVFVGKISDDDLPAYFAASRLFCLASTQRSEAYGVVIVEALAMGRPVVATDIPGSGVGWVNRDGVTGLNVAVGDAAALAGAIGRLLGDTALAGRFATAARQRYAECLSASAMVDATKQLYERVLARPRLAAAC